VGEIINRAVEKGLLLINAGTTVIRFIPPLIASKQDVDDMTVILDECFSEMNR
jgi:acetylornithine/N-succinyldiaminopimelate aminotransferase